MSNFQDAAREVISNYLKKAIFIDDKATLPFSKESLEDEFCLKLFNSFRANHAVIDFYPYKTGIDVKNEILLTRNDLIILDWELSETTPKYLDTLKIIREIITNESPHFLCVYTHENSNKFEEILIQIKAYLNSYKLNISVDNSFSNLLEENGYTLEDFKEKNREPIKNYILSSLIEKKGKRKSLIESLRGFFGQDFPIFESLFGDLLNFCLEFLGFEKFEDVTPIESHIFIDNNCIIANNAIVIVVQKGSLTPDLFIQGFTDSILRIPHSYLTLLSLDYRTKFIEQSSFLGKEFQAINEIAFFQHQSHLKEEFESFIRELWKYDNTSFLNSFKSIILENINEFKQQNDVDGKIKNAKDLYLDLAKLNSFYNLTPRPFNSGMIVFGDIFKVDNKEEIVLDF